MTPNEKDDNSKQVEKPVVYGDPEYSAADDIYNHEEKVTLDDETTAAEPGEDGLDVPGAALDDKDEAIGEEDEENNYYSLGGDDHNDLEESEDD